MGLGREEVEDFRGVGFIGFYIFRKYFGLVLSYTVLG